MHFPPRWSYACREADRDVKAMIKLHERRKIHLAGALNDGVCHVKLYGNADRMTHDLTKVTCGHCQAWITRVIDNCSNWKGNEDE
jgi:hypothetical protein